MKIKTISYIYRFIISTISILFMSFFINGCKSSSDSSEELVGN